MKKSYYEDYYHFERGHWWFTVRSKIIEKTLLRNAAPTRPLRILNIGVATGASTQLLMKYGEVTSIEYDEDCCEFVSEVLGTQVLNASITELPFPAESFDLVCAFDVIEHVADHQLAAQEMDRVCRKDGWVYVTVPAFMSLWSKHDVINHHERRYKKRELQDLFKKMTGRQVFCSYFNTILFPPIFLFRQLSKLFIRSKNENELTSDFEAVRGKSFFGKVMNGILKMLFSTEIFFLNFMRFPFGVSIIYIRRKG